MFLYHLSLLWKSEKIREQLFHALHSLESQKITKSCRGRQMCLSLSFLQVLFVKTHTVSQWLDQKSSVVSSAYSINKLAGGGPTTGWWWSRKFTIHRSLTQLRPGPGGTGTAWEGDGTSPGWAERWTPEAGGQAGRGRAQGAHLPCRACGAGCAGPGSPRWLPRSRRRAGWGRTGSAHGCRAWWSAGCHAPGSASAPRSPGSWGPPPACPPWCWHYGRRSPPPYWRSWGHPRSWPPPRCSVTERMAQALAAGHWWLQHAAPQGQPSSVVESVATESRAAGSTRDSSSTSPGTGAWWQDGDALSWRRGTGLWES